MTVEIQKGGNFGIMSFCGLSCSRLCNSQVAQLLFLPFRCFRPGFLQVHYDCLYRYPALSMGSWPYAVETTVRAKPKRSSRLQYRPAVRSQLAASVLITMPIFLLFFFLQKTFVQGIALTGIKG